MWIHKQLVWPFHKSFQQWMCDCEKETQYQNIQKSPKLPRNIQDKYLFKWPSISNIQYHIIEAEPSPLKRLPLMHSKYFAAILWANVLNMVINISCKVFLKFMADANNGLLARISFYIWNKMLPLHNAVSGNKNCSWRKGSLRHHYRTIYWLWHLLQVN